MKSSLFSSVSSSVLNSTSDLVTGFTRSFNNVVGSHPVDRFMDSASGVGHRIVSGHDLSYVPEIYQRYGIDGVGKYFEHGLRDLMSPHGMPVPFANEIQQTLGLSTGQALDWLCLNVSDVLSGGLSIYSSALHYREFIDPYGNFNPGFAMASAMIKIFSSCLVPNPIVLISGAFDMGIVCTYFYREYGYDFFNGKKSFEDYLSEVFDMLVKGILFVFSIRFVRACWKIIRHKKKFKESFKEEFQEGLKDAFAMGVAGSVRVVFQSASEGHFGNGAKIASGLSGIVARWWINDVVMKFEIKKGKFRKYRVVSSDVLTPVWV